jgi:hypothetical protein
MQCLNPKCHLRDYPEYRLLLEHLVVSLEVLDFVAQISSVGVLHDEAQSARWLVDKSRFIGDHVGVLDRSEIAHFCKCIVLFPL